MSLHLAAMLVLAGALVGAGCQKRDPIVAEYSSVGSGRPGGGWTLTLYASGKWKMHGPGRGTGTYTSNTTGYQLETLLLPGSVPKLLQSVVRGFETGGTTLISLRTNGTEYLIDQATYGILRSTSDTNTLRYELKRIR